VSIRIGTGLPSERSREQTDSPSSRGIATSSTIASTGDRATSASARSPSSTAITR
jgi:hypothetical protein